MIHRFAISDPSLFQVFSGDIKSNLVGNQLVALDYSDSPAAKLTTAAVLPIDGPFAPCYEETQKMRDSKTGTLENETPLHRKRTA